MIDASIWIVPSIRIVDPVPAFVRGSSSRTTTAASTASSALPPRRRTRSPAAPAASAASRTASVDPAPQWVTRTGRTGARDARTRLNGCLRPSRAPSSARFRE